MSSYCVIGYTMVFKAVSGNNKDIYGTYNSDKTSAEDVQEALNVMNQYKDSHYKNRIALKGNWAKFDPSMVIVWKFMHELMISSHNSDGWKRPAILIQLASTLETLDLFHNILEILKKRLENPISIVCSIP